MALTAVEKCDIDVLLPLTVKALGIADPNTNDGSAVASGAPYSETEISDKLFQADYELAVAITESLDHPYRTQFDTEESGALSHGDLIPAHLGKHTQVTITDGGTTVIGSPRSLARVKSIRKLATPSNVYGETRNMYAIHAGRIYLGKSGTTAKVKAPFVQKGSDLLCPVLYQWGVIAKAVIACANVGLPENHRAYWANFAVRAEQMIREGGLSIPEPEQLERIEA